MRIRLPLAILAAGLGVAAPSAQAADIVRSFSTPSRNIGCTFSRFDGVWRARCDVFSHTWRAPARPASCDFDWGSAMRMGRTTRPRFLCVSDAAGGSSILAYGRTRRIGPFTCRSLQSGLRCTNAAGHGWKLSKQTRRFF